MMDYNARIFCAVDTADMNIARSLTTALSGTLDAYKLGLQFFVAHGPAGVKDLRETMDADARIFLDLKLHDIPNTVAGAVRSAVLCDVDFLTIHTCGGMQMIQAAASAAQEAADQTGNRCPKILGVTVLTSMGAEDLQATGVQDNPKDQVVRLAKLGRAAGLDGFVCSPAELPVLRDALGAHVTLVTPGVRPAGADAGDQKRIMTPDQAFAAGADYLVIGRPITKADSPKQAAQDILASL